MRLPYSTAGLIAPGTTKPSAVDPPPPVVGTRRSVAAAGSENRILLNVRSAANFYAARSASTPGVSAPTRPAPVERPTLLSDAANGTDFLHYERI